MSDIKVLEDKIDIVMVDIKHVEDKLDSELRQIDNMFDGVDDRLDGQSENVRSLLQWRDSNGSPGAESRLRKVEDCSLEIAQADLPRRVSLTEADVKALQMITDGNMRTAVSDSVNATLDLRSRTTIERMKAWSQLLTPILAAVAIVLAALL
jgi:hypothetical protein